MTYEEIYAKVRSGEMLLSEFSVLMDEKMADSYDEGYRGSKSLHYNMGYDDGYEEGRDAP